MVNGLMKPGSFQIRIRHKLLLLFFMFVLIFYGTLIVLFTNTRSLVEISEQIVSKNNEISKHSKIMYEGLLEMEANDRKYRLLDKEIYREYFEQGKTNFETSMEQILALDSDQYLLAEDWKSLADEYNTFWSAESVGVSDVAVEEKWAPEERVNSWLDRIVEARLANENEIEQALLAINENGKRSVRNGLVGMGVTIFAGLMAAFFLSRSILFPLQRLKSAIKKVSMEKEHEEIQLNRSDEFGELATTFNEMSRQLTEEEELRSEFIATLSHEIRTPLSSIRESVNMLLEGVLGETNEKQRKFLEIAGAEIARITDLLNYLLDVSQLEVESRRVTPELLDPNELVLEVIQSFIPQARKKKITLKFFRMSSPPVVIGVAKELQQVFHNLLDNAMKFSPKNGLVTVKIYFDNARKEHRMLVVEISDQGPGVSEDEQNLIFTKYYRTKAARKGMDGVGLGLSISKRIIQFHDGDIYVKNNRDTGCSFYCLLPCEVEAATNR